MGIAFNIAVRLEARAKARDLGYTRSETRDFVAKLTDHNIAEARAQFKLTLPEELAPNGEFVAFGDGSILKGLFAWIGSPEGQAFIKFIIGLFIGMI